MNRSCLEISPEKQEPPKGKGVQQLILMKLLPVMMVNGRKLTKLEISSKEMKGEDLDQWLKELLEKYSCIEETENSPSIEEILKQFDENGNWIVEKNVEDEDWDKLIKELEERYDNVELPDSYLSVDEILAKYDDHGNEIDSREVSVNDVDNATTGKKKRYRRRNRKNKQNKTEQIEIIHSNTCGYTSKQESWKDILKEEHADVVTMNETSLKGKRKIKQKGYFA